MIDETDERQMEGKPPIDQALQAISYSLRRIREEWNIGYHMGEGTQAFALLAEAYATLNNEALSDVREKFSPQPKHKCDTQILREIKTAWQDYLCDRKFSSAAEVLIEKLDKIMKEDA